MSKFIDNFLYSFNISKLANSASSGSNSSLIGNEFDKAYITIYERRVNSTFPHTVRPKV